MSECSKEGCEGRRRRMEGASSKVRNSSCVREWVDVLVAKRREEEEVVERVAGPDESMLSKRMPLTGCPLPGTRSRTHFHCLPMACAGSR